MPVATRERVRPDPPCSLQNLRRNRRGARGDWPTMPERDGRLDGNADCNGPGWSRMVGDGDGRLSDVTNMDRRCQTRRPELTNEGS